MDNFAILQRDEEGSHNDDYDDDDDSDDDIPVGPSQKVDPRGNAKRPRLIEQYFT